MRGIVSGFPQNNYLPIWGSRAALLLSVLDEPEVCPIAAAVVFIPSSYSCQTALCHRHTLSYREKLLSTSRL